MPLMITRRFVLMTPMIALSGLSGLGAQAETSRRGIELRLKELETRSGGRLGIPQPVR